MAPPKAKAQKVSLGAFLADSSLGDWADDVGDLPSAPGGFDAPMPTGPSRSGGDRYASSSMAGDRGAPRGDVAFPTQPPYNAYIGNLSYEINENDIESLFKDLKVKSVRLLRDTDDNIKGFGYCEFDDADSLRGAVALHGSSVKGRAIKIDVSEAKGGDRGGRGGFGGDRRERGDTRFGGFDDSPSDWRSAPRREIRPTSPERSFGGAPARQPSGGFGGAREGSGFGGGFGGERRDFNNGPRPDRDGFQRVGGPGAFRNNFERPETSGAPAERKRLDLKPRTVDASVVSPTSAEQETTSPVKAKANPFGSAQARDEDAIMRRVEEKLAQKDAERKAAEAEARKAREEAKATEIKKVAPGASAAGKSEETGSWRRDGPRPAMAKQPFKKNINDIVKEPKPAPPVAAKAKEVKPANVFDLLNNDEGDAPEDDE
ncbi:hypothetical protein BJ741DRAFT_586418 [Chytriomyces cf. hyalinus JEL632]|nr:hypothetical protein BJ741DRAFT_586418 [Chytriomyces cf. hyalinus JEL632]